MTRAILGRDVGVIGAPLVGVTEQDADRRPIGLAVEDARPDFGDVLFLPLRDNARLARPAAAQIGEQVLDAQGHAGRAAVDDAEVARAVADAGRGDAEPFAEGIAGHGPHASAKRRETVFSLTFSRPPVAAAGRLCLP